MKRSERLAAGTAVLTGGLVVLLAVWLMRTQRREYYVSERFLTWLQRQEADERAEMARAIARRPLRFGSVRPNVETETSVALAA